MTANGRKAARQSRAYSAIHEGRANTGLLRFSDYRHLGTRALQKAKFVSLVIPKAPSPLRNHWFVDLWLPDLRPVSVAFRVFLQPIFSLGAALGPPNLSPVNEVGQSMPHPDDELPISHELPSVPK